MNARVAAMIACVWLCVGAVIGASAGSHASAAKPAAPATVEAQGGAMRTLPQDDGLDQEFVQRGFIATRHEPLIRAEDGHVVWDLSQLDWIQGDGPMTVNPSLWRHMKLLKEHGLFKVAEGGGKCVVSTLPSCQHDRGAGGEAVGS
jgi:alkyl sulfatase BDS1-like metallo-beta-lactamase superfamily hydrolase